MNGDMFDFAKSTSTSHPLDHVKLTDDRSAMTEKRQRCEGILSLMTYLIDAFALAYLLPIESVLKEGFEDSFLRASGMS
jgi:hypothetical protein